jgi:uncharacterized protein YbjT (DUF2867 family)
MGAYVVAGVTGRVGSIVAGELLSRREAVKVIVRQTARAEEWMRRGAEVAIGSLDDRRFVRQTLQEASGFFTLLPENVNPDDFHGARRRMADAIADAIRDNGGLPHVVMLSALAAVLAEGNGPAADLHYLEQRLGAVARRLTILRASYLQDNLAGVLQAARGGVYPNFLASADAMIPMIATRDIGRFAAHALLSPPAGREVIDLLGPMFSARQVAAALGRALGNDVKSVDIPPARHSDALAEAGIPRPIADAVAEMFASFNAGLIRPEGERQLVGTTSIEEVVDQCIRASVSAAGSVS